MLVRIRNEEEARRYASGGSLNTMLHGLRQGKPVWVTMPTKGGSAKDDVDIILKTMEGFR